ncbi:hypothetical protein [uncultured Cohaesibacter sp.]|uniref:hypothetical protein n=1 Tax=uncultured Cohaesibacter sp. TaxID=1002546 RepID=UPI0029C84182|nr:hypothetical protein [uncultured Cohaesibacter sp.]
MLLILFNFEKADEILAGLLPCPSCAKESDWDCLDFENFRSLDVQKWSTYKEIGELVQFLYDRFFKDRKADIAKKHLKVILLDLYVCWIEHPDQFLAVSLNNNDYHAKSRYNALHISKKTIQVVKTLYSVGLICLKGGFHDRDTRIGKLTRIRATEPLIELFRLIRLELYHVRFPEDRELIILSNTDVRELKVVKDGLEKTKISKRRNLVEYEDTKDTSRMREILKRYNGLLADTFIDIPSLEEAWGTGHQRVCITHLNKYVHRTFNRSSFDYGGRFYGAWWMQCSKELRKQIFINDRPTSELDYKGLHIVMLYALEGIEYWSLDRGDPYEIEVLQFQETGTARKDVKLLMLMLINASSVSNAYKAFRRAAEMGSHQKRYTNANLEQIYKLLKAKHPEIAHHFGSDIGITLMNLDAKITEIIIETFTEYSVPVLTVHDSYIVKWGWEKELEAMMHTAFSRVLGVSLDRRKERGRAITYETENKINFFEYFKLGCSDLIDEGYMDLECGILGKNKNYNFYKSNRYELNKRESALSL